MSLLQWVLIRGAGLVVTAIRGDPPARQVSFGFPSTSWRECDRNALLRWSRTWH
jgi:hypothetical protein